MPFYIIKSRLPIHHTTAAKIWIAKELVCNSRGAPLCHTTDTSVVAGQNHHPSLLMIKNCTLQPHCFSFSVFPVHNTRGKRSREQHADSAGVFALGSVVALCQGGPRRPGSVCLRGWAGLTKASVDNTRGRTSSRKRSCEMLRDTWSLLTGARA